MAQANQPNFNFKINIIPVTILSLKVSVEVTLSLMVSILSKLSQEYMIISMNSDF